MNIMRMKNWRMNRSIFLSLLTVMLFATSACAENTSSTDGTRKSNDSNALGVSKENNLVDLCAEFDEQLNKRGRLSALAVEGSKTEDGVENIHGVDIDGDKTDDKVIKFCPGSGSIIPADPCTLRIVLSSSGKEITFEEQRLGLIRYKSKFYVVTSRITNEKGPIQTGIHSLQVTGLTQMCAYECGQAAASECKRNVR